jgi:hypothetical protein
MLSGAASKCTQSGLEHVTQSTQAGLTACARGLPARSCMRSHLARYLLHGASIWAKEARLAFEASRGPVTGLVFPRGTTCERTDNVVTNHDRAPTHTNQLIYNATMPRV